mgnify:CR=1 FL=1
MTTYESMMVLIAILNLLAIAGLMVSVYTLGQNSRR